MKKLWALLFTICLISGAHSGLAQAKLPTLSVDLGQTDQVDDVVPALKIVGLLTILSVAPAILLMMTSFTRIVIILSFVRQALGTQTMPPNQVILGLSLFLTYFTMSPVIDTIQQDAYTPYVNQEISQEIAIENVLAPIKKFLLHETRKDHLALFYEIARFKPTGRNEDIPMSILIPSFMTSELKTAFQVGFLIYIPFLIIDMVVSSVLMAMGMMMLPPTVISLPFKLVLFVLVDGWSLIVTSVVQGFHTF
ncbi:MAG: flagellar type III secretion system pore protein FliP [Oligoflexales bacterium]